MADIYDMLDTWNAGATTFTAIKMSVTDTASAAGSLLMDLQVGGVSKFSVDKAGRVGAVGPPNISFSVNASGAISASQYFISATGGAIYFTDLLLFRDAANTFGQRNGVNPQAFNLYNTYDNSLNYERGFIGWASSEFRIVSQTAGTGSVRGMRLVSPSYMNLEVAGADRLSITPTIINANVPIEFVEQTAPAAPAANRVRIYAEDDGAGKTRLMARFATGAAQQIAIEP